MGTSSPSANIMYHTAGTWPSKQNTATEDVVEVTSNLRLLRRSEGVGYEMGPRGTTGAVGDQNETYTAELWKTSDGGKTWKNLIADKGNFFSTTFIASMIRIAWPLEKAFLMM